MADAVTSQILVDGERNAVMKFTNISDGTGEAGVLKVDVSALAGTPTSVRIDRIDYDVAGMAVNIQWDATSAATCIVLANHGTIDLCDVGGLQNNAGAGKTGDVLFTTIGHSANDTYSIVLHMRKV